MGRIKSYRGWGKSTRESLLIIAECYDKMGMWVQIYDHHSNTPEVIKHKVWMLQDLLKSMNFQGFKFKQEGSKVWIKLETKPITHPNHPDIIIPDYTQKTKED